jgi:hypothetical protein
MATWSISPDTSYVSIDNTGKLTYQRHTADTQYTVSYVGDNGCTASKEITIKRCDPGRFKKNLSVNMAINGRSISTFILAIEIRHVGESSPVYYNNLGVRNLGCHERDRYSDSIDIELLLDDELSAYTFSLHVESCHGWTTSCVDDTSSYSFMINGQSSSTGGISVNLSEIPTTWQYSVIAIPSH